MLLIYADCKGVLIAFWPRGHRCVSILLQLSIGKSEQQEGLSVFGVRSVSQDKLNGPSIYNTEVVTA